MQHEVKTVKATSKKYKTKDGVKESISKRVDLGVDSIFTVGDEVAITFKTDFDSLGNDSANIVADRDATITIANAKKEAQQIIAEGEAEYMKILADAYNDREKAEFYNYLRGIDALRLSLKGDKTLILDKDSEIVKILYGEN